MSHRDVLTLRDKWIKELECDDDPVGLRICSDNRDAIEAADEIHLWYSASSTGSLFDLGMTFALRKKLVLACPVDTTDGKKGFNNVVNAWAENGRLKNKSPETSLSIEKFDEILPKICDTETSLDSAGWSKDNPLYGHCAVASVLAQGIFGGRLMRADLTKYSEYAHMRSHYVNLLPNGEMKDFTLPQFKGKRPNDLEFVERTREYVLSNPDTAKRYNLLLQRFKEAMNKY